MGKECFSEAQTRARINYCRDSLAGEKRLTIRLKNIYYHGDIWPEHYAKDSFNNNLEFDRIYAALFDLPFNGYLRIDKGFIAPIGSFWPWVRFYQKSYNVIDCGCLWIGSKSSYPRIWVDNQYSQEWWLPIDYAGNCLWQGFLPRVLIGDLKENLISDIVRNKYRGKK